MSGMSFLLGIILLIAIVISGILSAIPVIGCALPYVCTIAAIGILYPVSIALIVSGFTKNAMAIIATLLIVGVFIFMSGQSLFGGLI